MLNTFKSALTRFKLDECGATLVEYGIALSLAIALGAGAFVTLSNDMTATMTATSNALPEQSTE